MNFEDTLKSTELVLATGEVPLIVGESGIGKTAMARAIATKKDWSLVVIDGNLLKEGEIGGLPTIEVYRVADESGEFVERKTTVYAVHHKLREMDREIQLGKQVLLFIDEINRCEHTVQQELMNLILNREINGCRLHQDIRIMAAMNPSAKYGSDFDYQVVDMDPAQENRFVWLFLEPDPNSWLDWALRSGIDSRVTAFISTFPEYLHHHSEDDIRATPRSYERISKLLTNWKQHQDTISRSVFLNVVKGNAGKLIAEEFLAFIESDTKPLISYGEVFTGGEFRSDVVERLKEESHTRLYLTAKNLLIGLEAEFAGSGREQEMIQRLVEFLKLYPVDLRIAVMKDIKYSFGKIYSHAIENESFVEAYFDTCQ